MIKGHGMEFRIYDGSRVFTRQFGPNIALFEAVESIRDDLALEGTMSGVFHPEVFNKDILLESLRVNATGE